MVRVADITLLIDTILYIVAQAETSVTTSTDRVGILHTVDLVEGCHPVTTLLGVVDGTTCHVAVVLHLEDPDTLSVTLRTALVVPAEHVTVVIASFCEILTITLRDQFVVTATDDR